jgi:hypothetical protein
MEECYASQVRRDGDALRAGKRRTRAIGLLGVATLVLAFAGIATAGAAQASEPANAAGGTWKVEPTPNPAGAEINYFFGVSCSSGRACTAVGAETKNVSTPGFALAERWNGKRWNIQATAKVKGAASTELNGVSCPSARYCSAVGTAFISATSLNVTLAEAWNGKTWRVQPIPDPAATDGILFGISCTSASACTAVGYGSNTAGDTVALAERWNGKTWRSQALPRPAKNTWLFGVSCSTARACTAVGYQNKGTGDAQPLAEAWNGTKWHAQTVPLPKGAPGGAFRAVSCTTPSACTASGTSFGDTGPTLAERWNGKAWSIQPTPNPPNYVTSPEQTTLSSVSCASAKTCTATGEYAPGMLAAYFLEVWNGKSWHLQTAPVPSGFKEGALLGVSCIPARCVAAGLWTGTDGQLTLAMAN